MTNVSLKKLLYEAYQVKDYQISGPDWIGTEDLRHHRHDPQRRLAGRHPGNDAKHSWRNASSSLSTASPRIWRCTASPVDKGGPKLKEVEFGRGSTSMSGGKLEAVAVPMRNLVEALSRLMARPVLDMTGLKGSYTFTLTFAPEERSAPARQPV